MRAVLFTAPLWLVLSLQIGTCNGQSSGAKDTAAKKQETQNQNKTDMQNEKITGKIGFLRDDKDSIELGLVKNARVFKVSKEKAEFEAIRTVLKEAEEKDLAIELTFQGNAIVDVKLSQEGK
jgi:hypothetical protein